MSGAEITEAEHAVTLHEEEVIIDKKVVPKRARAARDRRLHREETVDEDVRKEQIDTERDRNV